MISMAVESFPQTFTTLTDRGQYQHCHITVADMEGRLPAIAFNQEYYYFFRTVSDRQRATTLAAKLIDKGDVVIMTTIPKGAALWVLEPNAQPVAKRRLSGQPPTFQPGITPINTATGFSPTATMDVQQSQQTGVEPTINTIRSSPDVFLADKIADRAKTAIAIEDLLPFPILLELSRFADCQIQVPDLDDVLAAISCEGNYYSFFRTINTSQDLITITRKLAERGDQAVITAESGRYSIWILETDATVVNR